MCRYEYVQHIQLVDKIVLLIIFVIVANESKILLPIFSLQSLNSSQHNTHTYITMSLFMITETYIVLSRQISIKTLILFGHFILFTSSYNITSGEHTLPLT